MYKKMYLECPSHILPEVDKVIDGHFIIASELERNEEYQNFFLEGRNISPVMLDNGMYETGQPLSWKELKKWVFKIHPNIVFAPDYFCEGEKTFFSWLKAYEDLGTCVGFIPHGKDPNEIVYWIGRCLEVYGQTVIGLTFQHNRPKVLKLIRQRGFHLFNSKWHALGLCSWKEHWELPSWISSYDTVKPLKAAYHGMKVEELPRGIGKWSSKMKIQRMDLVFRNIAAMRRNPNA